MSSIAILLIYRPTLSIKPRWWWFCDVLWTLVLARASFNTNTCAIVSTFHAIQASFCAQAASVKRRMYDQVGGQGNQGPSRHRKPRVVCFLFILVFFKLAYDCYDCYDWGKRSQLPPGHLKSKPLRRFTALLSMHGYCNTGKCQTKPSLSSPEKNM